MTGANSMYILIANVGSTSFKFQLFDSVSLLAIARGRLERIGASCAPVQYRTTGGDEIVRTVDLPDFASAIRYSMELMADSDIGVLSDLSEIAAVGFKPVHGQEITGCRELTVDILTNMEAANPLAPAHNPPYIEAVRLFAELMPDLPLYGLFEPTFHQTMPPHAQIYGVPYEWAEQYGIRRYGFHGASHRYIAERTPVLLGRAADALKIVSCHLGGSSSLCAVDSGRSVDTTMGLSPQSGLMQSSRNGDLDPFAVLYVMDRTGMTTDEMRTVLCKQSGLKGLSGVDSGDMRDILEAEQNGDARAHLAADAFVYEIKKHIGAYAAAMGGLDAIIFTGGIGERSPVIRERICNGLGFLGVVIDRTKNHMVDGEAIVSEAHAQVTVAVVPANEELVVAREVVKALGEV